MIIAEGAKNGTFEIARAEVSVGNIRLTRRSEAVNVY